MKLKLGENLRRLRKEKDLTQEQFAESIGVSFQAVSRWENGTAYPDMELLPSLSAFFDISVDALIGCPEEEKARQAEELLTALEKAAFAGESERVIPLIREIRRDHLDSPKLWRFWPQSPQSKACFCQPKVLQEVRLTAEKILDINRDTDSRTDAIFNMAMLEDDEHIDSFLSRYATAEDLSKETLLRGRYASRGEWEKYARAQQQRLFGQINDLMANWCVEREPDAPEMMLYMNTAQLQLLHNVNTQAPDKTHPISANGEVDIFAYQRLQLGMERACYLAAVGETEETFIVLEDVISLLEKVMRITTPELFRCTSPWLKAVEWTAEKTWWRPHNDPQEAEEQNIWLHCNAYCECIYPSNVYEMLEQPCRFIKGGQWLERLRDDPRYTALVERVKALIVTRTNNQ